MSSSMVKILPPGQFGSLEEEQSFLERILTKMVVYKSLTGRITKAASRVKALKYIKSKTGVDALDAKKLSSEDCKKVLFLINEIAQGSAGLRKAIRINTAKQHRELSKN